MSESRGDVTQVKVSASLEIIDANSVFAAVYIPHKNVEEMWQVTLEEELEIRHIYSGRDHEDQEIPECFYKKCFEVLDYLLDGFSQDVLRGRFDDEEVQFIII